MEASNFYSDLTVDGITRVKNTELTGDLSVSNNITVEHDILCDNIFVPREAGAEGRAYIGSGIILGTEGTANGFISGAPGLFPYFTSVNGGQTRVRFGKNSFTSAATISWDSSGENGNLFMYGSGTDLRTHISPTTITTSNDLIVNGTATLADTTVDSVSFGTTAKINPRNFNIYGSLRPIYDSYDGSPFTTDSNLVVRKYDPPLSILSGSPGTSISVGIKDSI